MGLVVYVEVLTVKLPVMNFAFEIVCNFFFFFQAEDGIRDLTVTGVQTFALPICKLPRRRRPREHDGLAKGCKKRRSTTALQDASRFPTGFGVRRYCAAFSPTSACVPPAGSDVAHRCRPHSGRAPALLHPTHTAGFGRYCRGTELQAGRIREENFQPDSRRYFSQIARGRGAGGFHRSRCASLARRPKGKRQWRDSFHFCRRPKDAD